MRQFYRLFSIIFTTFLFSVICNAQVTYVDIDATGAGDGTSWNDAFTDLQPALDLSAGGEIWIAAGIYIPTSTSLDTFNAFLIADEIAIYGGFAGTEMTKEERTMGENTTTLSGDMLGNDVDNDFTMNKEDNVFHIMVSNTPISTTVILDALTFSGGATREESDNNEFTWRGGAIFTLNTINITNCNFNNNFARSGACIYISPLNGGGSGSIIDNCVFERNACVTQAAGIFVNTIDDVTVSNTTFQNNTTNRGTLYPIFCQNFLVDNCTFNNNISNSSDNFGGAMFIWNSTGAVRGCTFESNNSGNGAAIHIDGREMEVSVAENFIFDNCNFNGNSASDFGGGAIRSFSASYTIKDCEFLNNTSPNGGAIFSSGGGQEIIGSNNHFEGNIADFGASQASYGTFSNYRFNGNTYVGNAANTSGGGLINGFGANVKIDDCSFNSNIAGFGGAIFNQNDTTNVEISNTDFVENTVSDGNGGAINISAPVTVTIDKCLFESNSAGFGGALNGNQGNDVDGVHFKMTLSGDFKFLPNSIPMTTFIQNTNID